jgi:hypothetical protein
MSDAESFVRTSRDAVVKLEKTMKVTMIAVCLLVSAGSTCAFAQSSATNSPDGSKTAVGANPASAGEATGQPASSGKGASGTQGTLMQQRQKAMSPQGSSGGATTGTLKQ